MRIPPLLAAALLAPAACAPADAPPAERVATEAADDLLARALAERRSDFQVEGEGVVQRLLPDDHQGDRHQRIVVRLSSGQTVLIAHNIDVAPRIEGIREGDRIAFSGEYEWNAQGGVIHWTHATAAGDHPEGWLEHGGRVYR